MTWIKYGGVIALIRANSNAALELHLDPPLQNKKLFSLQSFHSNGFCRFFRWINVGCRGIYDSRGLRIGSSSLADRVSWNHHNLVYSGLRSSDCVFTCASDLHSQFPDESFVSSSLFRELPLGFRIYVFFSDLMINNIPLGQHYFVLLSIIKTIYIPIAIVEYY